MTLSDKLTTAAVIMALIKFLEEGVSFYYHGNLVTLGHADPVTYGMLLAPILGAHAYILKGKSDKDE